MPGAGTPLLAVCCKLLCKVRLGLPGNAHSQFQTAPMAPFQGMAALPRWQCFCKNVTKMEHQSMRAEKKKAFTRASLSQRTVACGKYPHKSRGKVWRGAERSRLTTTSISLSHSGFRGQDGNVAKLVKRWREILFCCYSPLKSILTVHKSNQSSPSRVWFVHDGNLPIFILTHQLFHLTFSPCPPEEGQWVNGWVKVEPFAKDYPPHSQKLTRVWKIGEC